MRDPLLGGAARDEVRRRASRRARRRTRGRNAVRGGVVEMPFSYPVFLELFGKRAVVISSLALHERKDVALRDAGAEVNVFANGTWSPSDLDGAFIVVASSSDPDERDAIAAAARERGILVNVMDDVRN